MFSLRSDVIDLSTYVCNYVSTGPPPKKPIFSFARTTIMQEIHLSGLSNHTEYLRMYNTFVE